MHPIAHLAAVVALRSFCASGKPSAQDALFCGRAIPSRGRLAQCSTSCGLGLESLPTSCCVHGEVIRIVTKTRHRATRLDYSGTDNSARP